MAVSKTGRGSKACRELDRSRLGKYVGLAVLERARAADSSDEEPGGGGLDFNITSWHIRMLTDNPWNGGAGLSYQQVARMTPDQVFHRICDRDLLKRQKGRRTAKTALVKPDADGLAKGRAADGTPIRAKIGGQSLAKQIREKHRGT